MINIETKMTGDLEGALEKFAANIRGNVIRNGAQAAAQVFYDEAKLLAPESDEDHWFYGTHARYRFAKGNLKRAIYQVFAEKQSGNGIATYKITWNHKKAPYGFMVEFGTSRAPAHPFMRPAYDAGKGDAGAAANTRMAGLMK